MRKVAKFILNIIRLVFAVIIAIEGLVVTLTLVPYIFEVMDRQLVQTPTQHLMYHPIMIAPIFLFSVMFAGVVWLTSLVCPKVDAVGWMRTKLDRKPKEDYGWLEI